jgi:solute carrier family 10 (sodium/bile acid cotransporter), member 7
MEHANGEEPVIRTAHPNENDTPDENCINEELKEETPPSSSSENLDDDASPRTQSFLCFSPTVREKLVAFYWEQEFLILIIAAILLAKAYPPLGADYLKPDITSTWIAVIIIFFCAGLSLKTSEFTKALLNWRYNVLIQVYNFGVVSAIVFGISRGLLESNIIGQDLSDGMVVCACMPMTISTVVVLTKAAGGDEASSIFNSAAGNAVGVFLTPLLILGYLGVTGDIDLVKVFYQLALRVLLPALVGQVLQRIQAVQNFTASNKFLLKQAQTYSLVFIVYAVFCETFSEDTGSSVGDIFLMILFQFIALVIVMVLAWYMLRALYPNDPKLRVAGLYCCSHKTAAVGIPLISALYADSDLLGSYTLPLLVWHPLQLVVGSMIGPRLANFVKQEEIRLNEPTDAADTSLDGAGNTHHTNPAVDDTVVNAIEEGR